MKFKVDKRIFDNYSNLVIGVCIVKNLEDNTSKSEIINMLREIEGYVRENIDVHHPKIFCWREVYKKFGAKPSKYRSSIESLVRRVLKGNNIPQINALVDLYNYISLKYLLPVGGEDLDKIEEYIELTYAGENETPVKLLGEEKEEPPKPGEIIYKDKISAICRRFNWREAERTKLTENTKNAIIVIEGFDYDDVKSALKELEDLINKYLKCETKTYIVDSRNSEIEIK